MQTAVHTGLDAGANAGVKIADLKVRDQNFASSGCCFSLMAWYCAALRRFGEEECNSKQNPNPAKSHLLEGMVYH